MASPSNDPPQPLALDAEIVEGDLHREHGLGEPSRLDLIATDTGLQIANAIWACVFGAHGEFRSR